MTPIEINTGAELRTAVLTATHAAIARGARTLLWVDTDCAAWPLDDQALLDGLTGWLRQPGRRLQLLASDFEALSRRHPRFAQWRVHWMHVIDARCPTETPPLDLPTLLLDDGPTLLELWERDPPRGRAGQDAAAARAVRDRMVALWQRAEPAWPARPLGL